MHHYYSLTIFTHAHIHCIDTAFVLASIFEAKFYLVKKFQQMKKIRWDLIGVFGGATGVILAAISVLRSGNSDRFVIAGAMVVVFGGMGILLYKLLWAPKFNITKASKNGN